MKGLLAIAAMVSLSVPASLAAAPDAVQAVAVVGPDDGQMPLRPVERQAAPEAENWRMVPGEGRSVRNVTVPTLTPMLPDPAKATGAAVIVLPGGGFMALSMDHEGYKVGRWLADRGIAAFVLKYRLIPTPPDDRAAMQFMAQRLAAAVRGTEPGAKLEKPEVTDDALAALRLVRERAGGWGVDPAKVGMIGFSAGAMTALNVVRATPPGEGPAFFGYIYGPQDAVAVPAGAPPLFDAIAMDDPLFPTRGFGIVEAWRAAKRPVELHAYQKGYHGFGGLGRPGTSTTLLMEEFHSWLSMNRFLTASDRK